MCKSKVQKLGNILFCWVVIGNVICECILIAGYFIPQGWCVLASFISVHMDENNYANPHQFDPWRWQVR